jgi:thiol-disulfide isomerase/thioredoxin
MTEARRQILLTILAIASVHTCTPAAFADPPAEVQLKTISYRELGDFVKSQRGKVVVVDVWADFCVPCKREFPNLVQMNERYGADGLVCVSVSVDEAAKHDAALAFLVRQKAKFFNCRLTDKAEVWQKAWNVTGPPTVFVFDRQGKRAARFDSEDEKHPFTYEQVEALVRKLLRQGT